jgi:cyclopropane-fatty-acyl-phospholipid synthase
MRIRSASRHRSPTKEQAMSTAARLAIDWVERGYIPDMVIRRAIRRLCGHRLRELCAGDGEAAAQLTEAFVRAMDAAETAPLPRLANEQHYEVPAEFFGVVLGAQRKYSCAWWPEGTTDLA